MKKILVVGGQEAFTKTWAKQHLPNVGLEMVWFWNYERRKFPSFPKSADGVILLKEMCGHLHRNKAIKEAKRWGIPFAEISRQWLRALPILEEKGIVEPTNEPTIVTSEPKPKENPQMKQEAIHPDWEEYLDILLLEDDRPNAIEITERLSELITPYKLTEEMRGIIRVKSNRRSITNEQPKPSQPKESSVTVYFTNSMNRAYNIALSLSISESHALINFVTKCSQKKKPNVPSSVRNIFIENKVDNPTAFSGVLYHVFNENDCTTTAELINKAYERILGRKHNYTKPREVFAHYSCDWSEHNVFLEKPQEEPNESLTEDQDQQSNLHTELTDQIANLSNEVAQLTEIVQELAKQSVSLTQQLVELTTQPKQKTSKDDCVVIPKSELVEYIINNKLNITIK